MSICPNDREFDRYILGRLSEEEAREFEIHYFNCLECYEKLRDREEYVGAIVRKREELLAPPEAGSGAKPARSRAWFGLPAWAAWAAAAGLVLVAAGGIILRPWGRGGGSDESAVRGRSLATVAPAGDVAAPPAEFAWNPGPDGLEYRLELTGPGVNWTGSAGSGTSISLPVDVGAKLARGAVYTWRVKGYAPEGTLLYRSDKTTFRIR
jgi:hypothetical protein